MRLTKEQRTAIKQAVKTTLGDNASVWLFGSRVNDELKGGDIDLYIEVQSKNTDLLQAELQLYTEIIQKIGEQKIDIVMHQVDTPKKAIHEQALATGVLL